MIVFLSRFVMRSRAPNAVAFDQELESEQRLIFPRVHVAERPGVGFSIGALALRATETAQAVAVPSKALTICTAVLATH